MSLLSPVDRVGAEVEPLALSLFSEFQAALYVSTPITTGEEYFTILRAKGTVTDEERKLLRLRNTAHALRVIHHIKMSFPEEKVIDPISLDEPVGWNQDHFNAFWMIVIHRSVARIVLVDGWQYSTGCTWELSQALLDGLTILDERLRLLPAAVLVDRLTKAASVIGQDSSWMSAQAAVLHRISCAQRLGTSETER